MTDWKQGEVLWLPVKPQPEESAFSRALAAEFDSMAAWDRKATGMVAEAADLEPLSHDPDDYYDPSETWRAQEYERLGVRPCGRHDGPWTKTIGLWPIEGMTRHERYVRWCRERGYNPWCGEDAERCPEAKP